MAAEVGLALLSASLQVLFDRLASPAVVNFIKGKKLNPELLQRLKTTLYAVGAVLNDAENKQIKDVAVQNWLDDLKDAVYVADDYLDQLSTKAATQSRKKVGKFSRFLNFRDRNIGNKIEDIIKRLEDIAKHKDILGLAIVAGEKLPRGPPSTSLQEVSGVYGRDEDKEAIIDLLLSDGRSDRKIGVIPIVGMGGIGKTTLAQSVYNDETVRKTFDLFAWVCVSEEFNVFQVIKTVIESISGHCGITDFNLLQLDLKEKLKGKKFLIVLDDVWNNSPTGWDPLMTPFNHGSEGSKLIVTTRSERVASVIQTVPFHSLALMSDEDCWLVFKKHVSPSQNPTVDSYLEKNYRNIINRCKGLPLAARLLGGLFRSEPDVGKWDTILKGNIWDLDLSESESKTLPALRISYHYLPPHLKRCFVHCSLFPKGYQFERDELILLWMAEDLLQPVDEKMTLEEVGKEYFDHLMSRSFFQHSNNQFAAGRFVMHDLIHDLAAFFAEKFYRISKVDQENNISEETRHISYNMLSGTTELKYSVFEALGRAKALRTFLPIIPGRGASVVNAPHMLQMLLNLKCMRVLSLCKFQKLEILPKSICKLIHLRCLDLSHTDIQILPESLCKLHNLQTLKLQQCRKLTGLPSNIQDLVNLRFLDVSGTRLQEMPRGIGNCKNLHYLSDFIINKDQGAGIEELGGLPNIGNRLRIKNLQYVISGKEASLAKMLDKKGIESIELIWASNDHMLDSVIERERDILDKLQPHSDLRNLLISGFRGTRCSDWLGLQDMTQITLRDCKNCYSLPPLGQLPSLKKLEIRGFDKMVSIETEFYNGNKSAFTTPFPSLEYLKFYNMPAWQDWRLFEMGAYPQLQELSLDDCPKLVGYLPKHLPALKSLEIESCDSLCSFQIDGFPNLEKLYVEKCENLESIVVSESVLQNVQSITMEDNRPSSLKSLVIGSCPKLVGLPKHLPALKSLFISGSCDSLCSLQIDGFPNLERIEVRGCENVECIVVSESVLQNVQSITMEDNPNLVSLSRALPTLNLTDLEVYNCPNLKSLPRHMDKLLPNLKTLHIRGCQKTEWHGEGDMPPHLTHLAIDQSVFATFSKEWGLPNLTLLGIDGSNENVQCFPAQGLLLPSSITTLVIYNFKTVETLDCNGFLHLTSLKELRIIDCPKLEKIAGERLPSSVERLQIIGCRLLEERCRMKNAEIWPKISHIQSIRCTAGDIRNNNRD